MPIGTLGRIGYLGSHLAHCEILSILGIPNLLAIMTQQEIVGRPDEIDPARRTQYRDRTGRDLLPETPDCLLSE
jgi:hypothetical protein